MIALQKRAQGDKIGFNVKITTLIDDTNLFMRLYYVILYYIMLGIIWKPTYFSFHLYMIAWQERAQSDYSRRNVKE